MMMRSRAFCLSYYYERERERTWRAKERAGDVGLLFGILTMALWVDSGPFKLEFEGDIFLAMSLSNPLFFGKWYGTYLSPS